MLVRRISEVIAVELPVLGVECPSHLVSPFSGDRSRRSRHADLEGLTEVAEVDGTVELVTFRCKALIDQSFCGPSLETVEESGDLSDVQSVISSDVGLDIVVLDVDGEQSERGDVTRVERNDDAGKIEDVDECAGQQRAGAAESGEHEVTDIEAALDRDLAQRVGLVPGGDLEDSGRGFLRTQAELCSDFADATAGGIRVERDLPAEEVGRDPSEEDVGIGDGRFHTTVAVADRPRVGPAD